jgi:hypothetical protein
VGVVGREVDRRCIVNYSFGGDDEGVAHGGGGYGGGWALLGGRGEEPEG